MGGYATFDGSKTPFTDQIEITMGELASYFRNYEMRSDNFPKTYKRNMDVLDVFALYVYTEEKFYREFNQLTGE